MINRLQTVDVDFQNIKHSPKIFLMFKINNPPPRHINNRAVLEIFLKSFALEKPQAAQVVGNGVPPHGIKQADINCDARIVLYFLKRRVPFASARHDGTAIDEIIFCVDDAAETPRPLPVNPHVLMRKNRAALNNLEVYFLVDEIIFAEKFFGGVGVVKVIQIHR